MLATAGQREDRLAAKFAERRAYEVRTVPLQSLETKPRFS